MQQFRFRFFGKLKILFLTATKYFLFKKTDRISMHLMGDIFLYVQRERITMFQLGTYLQSWLFWHVGIHSILPCLTCPINNLFASSVCCTQLLNYSISFPLPTEILAQKKSLVLMIFSSFPDFTMLVSSRCTLKYQYLQLPYRPWPFPPQFLQAIVRSQTMLVL